MDWPMKPATNANDNRTIIEPDEVFGFASHLYIFAIFNIIINTVVIYLILFHSTKNMEVYKRYLLYSVATTISMDLHSSLVYGGYFLLPLWINCCTGICKHWGIYGSYLNYMIFEVDLSIMGFGLVSLMAYRYHILNGTNNLMKKVWFIPCMWVISIIYVTPIFLTEIFALNGMDMDKIMNYVQEAAPQYIKIVSTGSCAGFVDLNWALPYFVVTFASIFLIVSLALYYTIKTIFLLHRLKASMSNVMYAIQKQFVYSVLVQFTIPLFCYVIPISILLFVAGFGGKMPLIYSEFFVKTTLFHAPLNGLAVLLTIKSYRETLKQKIFKFFSKLRNKNNSIHVQVTIVENNFISNNSFQR